MKTIAWTDELSIGVERIDEEHKTLVAMLGDLGQAMDSGQGQQAVSLTAARMRQYAQQHFKTEESAMSETRFPLRTSHVAEHDAFIEKVLDLELDLEQGANVSATELWNFLWTWLQEHIQRADRTLGAHIRAAGPSAG